VLSERFAAVPRTRLLRDLLVPLRSALSNAHKRGNRGDAAKLIAVETVLTRNGALLAITDQGDGFDVSGVIGHCRRNERYFAHRGAGFSRFDRADAIFTYENGGRTLLLGFVAAGYGGRSSEMDDALERVTDLGWLRSRFATDLPELALGDARLESLRASVIGSVGGGRDLRYVLRVGEDGSPPRIRVLSGRLHVDAAAADADFAAACRLQAEFALKSVTIPRPLPRIASELRLVLYDMHPWMDLREHLADRGWDRKFLRLRCERVGRALARLHRSGIALGREEREPLDDSLLDLWARARGRLVAAQAGADILQRFAHLQARLRARIAPLPARPRCAIHGRFGFDSIQYGVDGELRLYRFEACRRSHPALDIGGFLADLAAWASTQSDPGIQDVGREAFLRGYNAKQAQPVTPEELGPYAALALLDRLDRSGPLTREPIESVLERCERSLEDED
jgi:hypothetical protein